MPTPTHVGGPRAALMPLLRVRLRPYLAPTALLLLFQLVQAIALLSLPPLHADIVDNGIATGDTRAILGNGAIMLAATLVQAGAAAAAVYLGAKVAMGLGRDLRAELFERVQRFAAREFDRFGAPSLITRTTNDVRQVQMLAFIALNFLVSAPITGVGGVVMALRQDIALAGVLAVAVPVQVAAISLIIIRMLGPSRLLQGRIDEVNRVLRELIAGIRVIRAFVRESHEHERFARANTDVMAVAERLGRIQAFFGASATVASSLAGVAVLAIGGPRIAEGATDPGALIAFLTYLSQILAAVMMAMSVFMLAPRAEVSARRITWVLCTPPSIPEPRAPAPLPARGRPQGVGNLDIEGVTYRYPGAEYSALRDVNLIARPGQVTAVVGSTGEGKSTLVRLVARLLAPDWGTIRVDGVDLADLDRRTLAATIGLVPQRAYLFSGTIASNLRYGAPEADAARLWWALEVAQAADFVWAFPDGLDTTVGQGGTTVSGGQRQRLAVARVLVAQPHLYVFDDTFSALDTATGAAVRSALDATIGDAARLVVAQRMSTIRTADRIAVLDFGRVEAVGTHDELLSTSPTYAEIVDSQSTPEEAE